MIDQWTSTDVKQLSEAWMITSQIKNLVYFKNKKRIKMLFYESAIEDAHTSWLLAVPVNARLSSDWSPGVFLYKDKTRLNIQRANHW